MTYETENKALATFEGKKVRRIRYNDKWYFSVVDIIEILTESPNPRNYWKVLKHRLLKEARWLQNVTNSKCLPQTGKIIKLMLQMLKLCSE